jgi:hypothetical protein
MTMIASVNVNPRALSRFALETILNFAESIMAAIAAHTGGGNH